MSISNNPLIKTGIKPKIYKNRDCKNRRVAIFFVLSVLMGLFTVVGHFGLFHSKKKNKPKSSVYHAVFRKYAKCFKNLLKTHKHMGP